jgi:LPXTG-site transpeptidase (sortase) family protein
MALYYYKKAPPKIKKINRVNKGLYIATILDNTIYYLEQKITAIKPISFVIPLIFILSGFAILYGQIKPFAIHFIQSKFTSELNQEIIPLVPDSYEELRDVYISDPGTKYFSHLLETSEQESQSANYKGKLYLTIDKIKIYNAPVTANVDSTNEDIYKAALGHGLAHFKGTRLPGEEGNVLIYGHSAAGDYADKHPQDVVTAFTRLNKLTIGDKITLKKDSEEFHYTIKKIKEVNPEDVDIINPGKGKLLTLMTCSPPGLNSNRLIVVAIQQ